MKPPQLKGIAVSPGLAIAHAQVLDLEPELAHQLLTTQAQVEEELRRFQEALLDAEQRLQDIQRSVEKRAGQQDAMIFQAQLSILKDSASREEVCETIKNGRVTADTAVYRLMRGFEEKFQNLADTARDWASEVRDPWNVVLLSLQQYEKKRLLAGREKVILVTEELTPSLAMYLEKQKVAGIVSERGGKFSHGAILARSFGIPAVAGVEKATSRVVSGSMLVVNGDEGTLWVDPDAETLEAHRKQAKERLERQKFLAARAPEPCTTQDGVRVQVLANIESLRDFDTFDLSIVDGVGLLRTEFLFRERRELPSEEEQVSIYRAALDRMAGRELTFRTLDVGGDKPLPMFTTPSERNPALGWRGLRISLQWKDLLIVQLRALLRASAFGPVRILLPMVTQVEEVRTVRKLLTELQVDLQNSGVRVAPKVPLGIMVEVPGAAFLLPHVTQELDFFSIGTNDLTQYLLAVDRDNPWVASLYEPFHPAVIGLIDQIRQAAAKLKKEITICGEMAADPQAALLFLSMGIRSLSVAPNFVPPIKALLREANTVQLEELRKKVIGLATGTEIREALTVETEKLWKEFSKSNQQGKRGGKS